MYNWKLDNIYSSFKDEKLEKDFSKVEELIKEGLKIDVSKRGDLDIFKSLFKISNDISEVGFNIGLYAELVFSADSNNIEAMKCMGRLDNLNTKTTEFELVLSNYIKDFPNFIDKCKSDSYLKDYIYVLSNMYDSSTRQLSDESELLLSKLSRSANGAFERLSSTLQSSVTANYKGKEIPLSEVRNLAYSSNGKVRKEAYKAELACYKKIDKGMASCLSSIKQHTITIAKERKFESPLDRTLHQSGMSKATLDALLGAIEEAYPIFRTYLKTKAQLLGYKNGLPFYELFAPVGKSSLEFTVESAQAYLSNRFNKFNKEIGSLMDRAFEGEWIDYLPREGKAGGAFCAEVPSREESRILTNFDGTFGSVSTLAHELGHAFHNEVMRGKPMILRGAPMQLAETASTFNETFIRDDAISCAKTKAEKLNLVEASLADDTQVIVDIMSRYYFESSVFEKCDESALSEGELCELMIDAQKRSYGDGLDKEFLHPYMWACKSHYYSTGLSFYNFPYAFGQLFAYGLYQIYKEKGEEFFPLYKKILSSTGEMNIKDCVAQAGINTEDISFWRKSISLIKERLDLFLELSK